MKITIQPFVSYVRLAGMVLLSALLLFGCSKKGDGPGDDGDNAPPTSKTKVAEATFTKINTATYPTTFEGDGFDLIAISDNHIYVIDRKNEAFRRYNITSNTWQDLVSISPIYNGWGYLQYHSAKDNKGILTIYGPSLYIYYPPEYPDAALRDSWVSKGVVPLSEYGFRGAASDGEYLYYMGNTREDEYSRQIDRYNPNTNFLEGKIGYLPLKLNDSPQAVAYDNKLFVVGHYDDGDPLFMVYDLLSKQGKIKPVPTRNRLFYTAYTNTLLVYQNYLIFMRSTSSNSSVDLYVFDIEGDQWLEDHIEIKMDLFSNSYWTANLLLSSSGKLYAAGTKAGDFVLYNVDFKVLEK